MLESLGDIEMEKDHIKVFLYSGHWYGQKDYYKLTKDTIKDIYTLIKLYPQMPISVLDDLLFSYDIECFKEYDMVEPFKDLVCQYGLSETCLKKYHEYIFLKQGELKKMYESESEKLEQLKSIYRSEFISHLQSIVIRKHIKAQKVIDLLPTKEFIDRFTTKSKYGDVSFPAEDLVVRILVKYVEFDKVPDDCKFELGISSSNRCILTPFTKKEYLQDIEKAKKDLTDKR